MDLPPGWHLSIEDRPSPAARNRLGRELGKHNRPHLHNPKWQWLGVFVREPDGNIAAGLAGSGCVPICAAAASARNCCAWRKFARASAAATPLGSTRFHSRRQNFIPNSDIVNSAGSIIRPTSSEFSSRSG